MDGLAFFPTFSPCVRSLAFLRESRSSTPAVFCMVAMGGLFIAPSMVVRPMFCTWSSLFVLVLADVAHVLAPYSSVARTVQVYTVFRIRGDTPQCVPESRFSRDSFWMPLFLIDSICGFHERRESSVAPKKICVSACGIILSPSLILTCSVVVEREKTVDCVLTWLIWSPQSCVHLCTFCAVSCILYAANVVLTYRGESNGSTCTSVLTHRLGAP